MKCLCSIGEYFSYRTQGAVLPLPLSSNPLCDCFLSVKIASIFLHDQWKMQIFKLMVYSTYVTEMLMFPISRFSHCAPSTSFSMSYLPKLFTTLPFFRAACPVRIEEAVVQRIFASNGLEYCNFKKSWPLFSSYS